MATLQVRNGSYRVLFCYRDRRHGFTLGRVGRREAELAAANVERVLLRVEQGLLSVPQGQRIVEFVRRDGARRPRGWPRSGTRRSPSGNYGIATSKPTATAPWRRAR